MLTYISDLCALFITKNSMRSINRYCRLAANCHARKPLQFSRPFGQFPGRIMINGISLPIIRLPPINLITGITEITLLAMGRIKSQFFDYLSCLSPVVEKSMLFPNQALPPPVYTNFSQLQAAAQRIPGVKDPERKTSMPAESPTHHDTSGVGMLP